MNFTHSVNNSEIKTLVLTGYNLLAKQEVYSSLIHKLLNIRIIVFTKTCQPNTEIRFLILNNVNKLELIN